MKSRLIDIPRLFRNYNILILIFLSFGFGSLVIIVDYQAHKKDVLRSREAIENEKKQFLKHSVDNAISYINYNNSKVEERLNKELSMQIQNAWKLAYGIYNRFKNSKSEQEIKTLIIETLRPLRYFNGRGYIYIINMDGYTQMHPITPEKEGHLLTDIKDISGKYVIQDEIKLMRNNKEGYINYLWTKPNSDNGVSHLKRAFLKRFEPYNWFLGLGEYQDDFKEDLKQETLEWFRHSYDPKEWQLFINDYDGKALIINSDQYKNGSNIKNITDNKGFNIFEKELDIAKNTDGDFLRYSWLDENTGEYTPRVSYVKGYNQWEWMIGASSSTATIDMAIAQKEKELIKDSFKRVTYLLLTMLGASVLFFIISQYINKRIRYNFNSFISEFETAISKHQMLKEDKFNLNELKRLSSSTNKLLEKHLKSLDELQLSEQKMRALNSTKDKFFSIIAHDLRNPFNALITLSSFLVDAIDSNDKEEAKELASIIETSSKQGFELLVNLLEWSRTQTGAIKYNPNLINLNRELKNPIQIIESIAESKQIRFKHDINKNITAFADPNMIRTIVRNLLSNAVKFTPREGVISIEANENETEIVIKIRDNGVGMSEEIIDDLFTIDVNTSAQGTEGETGTGLGLILCFEFVKKHKGRIWVESEKGKGSCFSFSIPKETTKP